MLTACYPPLPLSSPSPQDESLLQLEQTLACLPSFTSTAQSTPARVRAAVYDGVLKCVVVSGVVVLEKDKQDSNAGCALLFFSAIYQEGQTPVATS